MTKLLNDYQSWVDSGQASKASFIKIESQPEQYKCKNYQNTKIGNNPCQEKEGLYKGVDDLLTHLSRSNSDKRPTGVGQLVRSSIAEQGLLIPFDRDNQTLKRMTLKETMEMMYRLTDKSIEVNTKKYPYYPIGVRPNKVDEKDYLQPMTTMERIEVTIRDVRFDMNYLGAHYQNAVARSVDYNKVVEGKGKLFKTCLSVRFCGKFFSRDQYRMAVNAIETYYGLLDANAHFGYGDYMKGLLTMVVGSSSKIAAKDATLRWKVGGKEVVIPYIQTKGQLKKHNGVILTDLAMMSAFSNGGRVIRDRVGRTQKEFDQFLASKGFNLVNEKILEGFEREGAEASALELINNLLKVKTPEGRLVHHDIIDFFSDLDYSELKFVEKTISDMLVVFSYVGVPPWIPKDKRESSEYKRYLNSNYYSFFQYLSKYVELYPALKSKLPRRLDGSKVKVLDVLKVLASPLKFFRMKLEAEDPDYYFVLNELFLGLNKFLFTTKSSLESKGVALLLNFLRDPAEIGDLYLNLRNMYALLDVMHIGEQKGSFSEIAFHIQKLNKTEKLNFNALREYINHTSREENCTQSDNTIRSCVNNPHYDEFAKLGEYVLRRDISSESNLYKGLKTLLIDEKENLYKLINDFTPYLILR